MKTALLDIDGTLIDSVPLHEIALSHALKRFGFSLPHGALRGKTTDYKLEDLAVPQALWPRIKEAKQEFFEELLANQSVWINTDVYSQLVRDGYKVVFCTQSNEASARAALRRLGLLQEGTALFAGQNKRDPHVLRHLLRKLDCLPEEVLMVDDSAEVCAVAQQVGMAVKHVVRVAK